MNVCAHTVLFLRARSACNCNDSTSAQHIHTYVHLSTRTCVFVCLLVCMFACVCVCACVFVYVCMYINKQAYSCWCSSWITYTRAKRAAQFETSWRNAYPRVSRRSTLSSKRYSRHCRICSYACTYICMHVRVLVCAYACALVYIRVCMCKEALFCDLFFFYCSSLCFSSPSATLWFVPPPLSFSLSFSLILPTVGLSNVIPRYSSCFSSSSSFFSLSLSPPLCICARSGERKRRRRAIGSGEDGRDMRANAGDSACIQRVQSRIPHGRRCEEDSRSNAVSYAAERLERCPGRPGESWYWEEKRGEKGEKREKEEKE